MKRIIAHLDMDAFFASVEERNTPRFKGMPVAVGSDPKGGHGRGVVSTANYLAREYGIHSAMPISQAWQASQRAKLTGKPEVIFLPPDFEEYEKSSQHVLLIIKKYTPLVEQASVDEFYFDLSYCETFKKAEAICEKIKKEIRESERLSCSIGIGPNKLIAKIAAGMKKPDGFLIVPAGRQAGDKSIEVFLGPLSVREIPGIGPKTAELLLTQNIKTVKDLKKLSLESLKEMLGKWGEGIYYKARGQDNSPVVAHHEIKSIGEQNTFEQDTFDILFISAELEKYCNNVFKRFLASGFSGFKTIAVTVRFSDFQTISSAKSFKEPMSTDSLKKFQFEALKLLLPFLDKQKNPRMKKLRLIGVRIENMVK